MLNVEIVQLKLVLKEIESRSSRREYSQLLTECHKLYSEQRLTLVSSVWVSYCCMWAYFVNLSGKLNLQMLFQLKGIVQQRISDFSKKEALPSLTRSGCAYLAQVI